MPTSSIPQGREPVLAAWGAGVDSTAMLIELVERGEPVDHVLFADTGGERPATLAFIPGFRARLKARGVRARSSATRRSGSRTGRPTER